jgi:hypothetical protein
MNCPRCGKKIPARDRYCTYCGTSTGSLPVRLSERLPRRFKFLIMVAAITMIAIAAYVVISLIKMNEVWFIDISSYSGDPIHQPGVVIYSEYVVAKAPNIDGVLASGEWGEPVINMKPVLRKNRTHTEQPFDASFYCKNDSDNLYIAITLSSLNNKGFSLAKEGLEEIYAEIVFDGDNDGYPAYGDDMKTLGLSEDYYFMDQYVTSDSYYRFRDEHLDGEGVESYMKDTDTWVGELRIPLHSGDPQDLKTQPGDTIGIRWRIRSQPTTRWYKEILGNYNYSDIYLEWPRNEQSNVWTDRPDPPCRSLVLASGPESQEVK